MKKVVYFMFTFLLISTIPPFASTKNSGMQSMVFGNGNVVEASTTVKATVTASVLNVRSGASASKSVITTLKKGTTVTVTKEQSGWSYISYNGKKGWVSSQYLKKSTDKTQTVTVASTTASTKYTVKSGDTLFSISVKYKTTVAKLKILNNLKSDTVKTGQVLVVSGSSANTPAPVVKKEVTASALNLRETASANGKVITTLKKGTVIQVVKEQKGWSNVTYNGKTGWVSSDYLKTVANETPTEPTKPTVVNKEVTASALNFRETASANGKVITTLKKGTVVQLVKEQGDWTNVTYNGKTGWVSSDYLKTVANNTPTEPTTPVVKKYEVTASILNLRSGAGTNYSSVGTLYRGSVVELITTKDNWSNIKYNGKTGWVSSDYLKLYTGTSTAPKGGKTIIIDAGHGGSDPGSLSLDKRVKEANVTLAFALKLEQELEKQGYNAINVRTTDKECYVGAPSVSAELQCRINYVQKYNADLYISIHQNWFYTSGPNGTETYYSSANPKALDSKILATLVHNRVQPVMNSTNRGVKDENYYVIKYTKVPAILVEVGFMSNTSDLNKLLSSTYQTNIAKAMVQGVNDYFTTN